jgi:hypothetical protein
MLMSKHAAKLGPCSDLLRINAEVRAQRDVLGVDSFADYIFAREGDLGRVIGRYRGVMVQFDYCNRGVLVHDSDFALTGVVRPVVPPPHEPQIDDNVFDLVMLLNELGFETVGSCGGHKNPTSVQQSEGKWFVSMYFRHCPANLRVRLRRIFDELGVEQELQSSDVDTVLFIRGTGAVTPETVVRALSAARTDHG